MKMMIEFFIITAVIFTLLIFFGGCSQREVRYYAEPNDITQISYKTNKLMSDEDVQGVTVIAPNGWRIIVGPVSLRSDAIEIVFDPIANRYMLRSTKPEKR